MTRIEFEPWEPEETVGKLWHAFASRLDAPASHADAAVGLDEVAGRLAVFFRGLGGGAGVEIRAAAPEESRHRLSRRRRLGVAAERIARAAFDGETLRLPPRLAAFPWREANAALYLWLAACAAHAVPPRPEADPLAADVAQLAAAEATVAATLGACPGLRALHRELCTAARSLRPRRALPAAEAALEAAILAMLGGEPPRDGLAARIHAAIRSGADARWQAPRGYRPPMPVPLWPAFRAAEAGAGAEPDAPRPESPREQTESEIRRARRRKADQPARSDSLILHKFEAILSFAEFLNLNRRVDDDDPETAQKAAEDADEIALARSEKAPATRLKLHLDLSPAEAERERLSGEHLYPEWDARSGAYLPDHARVLSSTAEAAAGPAAADPAAGRRIRRVRRQFEALRPRRVLLPRQPDGAELDLDAAVRAEAELRAAGRGSERVWLASRPEARDLSVSILLDVSRSTESAVTGRAVIEIEREALTALAWGIEAAGDGVAIHAFSSLRRNRVFVQRCKGFSEPMGPVVEARIAGLRPGFYTRLGAALRHVSAGLAREGRSRRLLLVITDGKPNDLDHYEGRHGIEDSRMAIREARRAGHAVFGIAVDAEGKAWFPRIFGRGGFAVIAHPDRLTRALPEIYRHLVAA
ncbi:VWA domain-containing protein [Paralimibaculum aggregatum]|uniref:VWA domain-containing protein n=1 Tax=Paralimibaculum aggregatum TaxID=3036245 RepID=A0ABQ6LR74_9RHOB|nr:nitric oxide reductase D protein [Limibaculum sp. NKW23]GMG84388.1 VWA domain-containing protein [Limibaculum sp. NKW23]